jgi:tRNA(Leu) C34 or U34 (ribose-2'-O)-methylase TrmL
VLVLDSLEDPQNVGTLLRSAEAAGVHGVLFPTHRQAPLTPAAIKASAGAVEHLLLCPVDDLPGALSDLRIRGLRVAAAEADAPMTAAQADLRGPLAIVVGSEGQGLSPVVRRRADVSVRIPMRGAIGSLNAAVAGSILLFAAVAQRDPGGEGADRPRPATFDEIAAASSGPDAADTSTDASAEVSIDVVAAWPPGADEPVTDLAEAFDESGVENVAGVRDDLSTALVAAPKRGRKSAPSAAHPSTATATAPKRPRKPAPTTAAQKRSRAASATDAGPAPALETPAPAKAPRQRAKAAGPAPAPETRPAAKAPRKRAKAATPPATEQPADQNPAADDLLPGGPTDA